MKSALSLLFLIRGIAAGFSQKQFQKMPIGAEEIHFTYKKTSKIVINEAGVYADSALYKIYFPNLKYAKTAKPQIDYLNAVIPLEKFKGDVLNKLVGILYHENELYVGTYFVKKNKTIINVERNDEVVRNLLKKYFNKSYTSFYYKITLDYNKNIKTVKYPSISYDFRFDEIKKDINWFSPLEGTFVQTRPDIQFTNVALFDENLSDKVTFDYIFTNNTKGLAKDESVDSILELIEVHYK